MATLAAAFGTSHSLMLAAELDDWLTRFRDSDHRMPYFDRQGRRITFAEVLARAPADAERHIAPAAITARFHAVQAAMARLKQSIAAARLDAMVIVGDDQHELFQDQHMPSIGVYYGETIRNAAQSPVPADDWYRRARMRRLEEGGDVHYPCDRRLALHLIAGLMEREFDISAVAGLAEGQYEGHAYSFVHRWYMKEAPLPVVPIFLNTYNPPNQPHPRRCVKLGAALKALIEAYPADIRVGVIASGGLSHFVVEEDLDRGVIAALERKDLDHLAGLDPLRLLAGSSEIRNWIVMAAAAQDLRLDWLAYEPGYRSPALTGTGLAFAAWH
ncbi:MAG: hypothetical protein OHK0024_22180 [Thalassobaculales bacterium]